MEDKLSKDECILRELNGTDEDEFKKNLLKYKARLSLTHDNIVRLVGKKKLNILFI